MPLPVRLWNLSQSVLVTPNDPARACGYEGKPKKQLDDSDAE